MIDATGVSTLIAMLVTATGAACATWLTLVTLPLALVEQGRLRGRGAQAVAHAAPRLWRGVVATAVGVGASVAATGAATYESSPVHDAPAWGPSSSSHATPAAADAAEIAEQVPLGFVSPETAAGEVSPVVASDHVAVVLADVVESPTPDQHRVRPDDTLWAIAAGRLPDGASNARITEAWRAIYRENRAVVGADPGLIHPGQVLVIPSGLGS